MRQYTDKENAEIAIAAYKDFNVGDDYKTESGLNVGKVVEVEHDKGTGLDAFVVEEPNGNVSIMYQGSQTWEDWVLNNSPLGVDLWSHSHNLPTKDLVKDGTIQMEKGNELADRVLKKYPNSKVNLYGHSLGGAVVQYVAANMTDPNRLNSAQVFQAPNMYITFTDDQKAKVDANKSKIKNYVDEGDLVTFGYNKKKGADSHNAVGIVHHLQTFTGMLNFINKGIRKVSIPAWIVTAGIVEYASHLLGLYQWNEDGSVKTKDDSSEVESRFAEASAINSLGSYSYEELKKKVKAYGLTDGEKMLLDSTQSSHSSAALASAAKTCHQAILGEAKISRQKAEELYETLQKVPCGFSLTSDEVKEAYNDGGVNYDTTVGKMRRKSTKVMDKSREIKQAFTKYNQKIQGLIEKRLAEDAKFAKEFGIDGQS